MNDPALHILNSTFGYAEFRGSQYRSLDGAKRNPGLVFISQRRKARKGFWGKKIIAFDFLGVLGAFARVKSFPSLLVHSGVWRTLHWHWLLISIMTD